MEFRDFKKKATRPKTQGHCGSCWAFAATAVIESHVAIKCIPQLGGQTEAFTITAYMHILGWFVWIKDMFFWHDRQSMCR